MVVVGKSYKLPWGDSTVITEVFFIGQGRVVIKKKIFQSSTVSAHVTDL